MAKAIPLSWPSLIGKCRFIFLGYSHWSLTGRFGILEHSTCDKYHIRALGHFGVFGRESLGARKNRLARLATRGSGSQARKIASRLQLPRKRISKAEQQL